MKKKLGVCLIGCGRIGEVHARTYSSLKDEVELFLCDSVLERAKLLKDRYGGAKTFLKYEEAIKNEEVDLVDICLPHNRHVEPVELVCDLNKHILLEKPVARNLKEADEILRAIKDFTGKFMVAECWRFYPHIVKAKELIQRGEIGDVFLIQVNSLGYYVPPLWRRNKDVMGGGVLIDRGIHFIDMLLYLGGKVESVFSECAHKVVPEMEGEDTAIGILRFKNGIIGEINVSWGIRNPPLFPWFVVYGSKGNIYGRQRLYITSPKYSQKEECVVIDDREVCDDEMVDLTIKYFLDCVRENKHPIFTPGMARDDLEVVEAIYFSWKKGKLISLPLE